MIYGATKMISVYYDGGCPVCVREIGWYRCFEGQGKIEWVDITSHADELKSLGIDPEEALLELFVKDQNGCILRGIDAFVLLFQQVMMLRPLAWLLAIPVSRPWIKALYNWSTRRRLKKAGRLPKKCDL